MHCVYHELHIAVNPDVLTAAERATARNTAKDAYLAICFLMNSDKRHYGGLIRDIENEHINRHMPD
jgi:hypothetical protein